MASTSGDESAVQDIGKYLQKIVENFKNFVIKITIFLLSSSNSLNKHCIFIFYLARVCSSA